MTGPDQHPGPVSAPSFMPDDTPVGVDGVETAIFDGEAVLFHERTSMVHRLTAVAGAVWLLCDGGTTVESMPDELAEVFSVPPEDLRRPVAEALEALVVAGLLAGTAAAEQVVFRAEPVRAADGTPVVTAPPDP
jgi:hypothetical protein